MIATVEPQRSHPVHRHIFPLPPPRPESTRNAPLPSRGHETRADIGLRTEVERAIDNLVKSGKMFAGGAGPQMSTTRRELLPFQQGRGRGRGMGPPPHLQQPRRASGPTMMMMGRGRGGR